MRLLGERMLLQNMSSRWRRPPLIQTAFPVTFILLVITGEAEAFSGLFQSLSTFRDGKETADVMLGLGTYLHFLEFLDGVCQCRWVLSSHCNTQKVRYYALQ